MKKVIFTLSLCLVWLNTAPLLKAQNGNNSDNSDPRIERIESKFNRCEEDHDAFTRHYQLMHDSAMAEINAKAKSISWLESILILTGIGTIVTIFTKVASTRKSLEEKIKVTEEQMQVRIQEIQNQANEKLSTTRDRIESQIDSKIGQLVHRRTELVSGVIQEYQKRSNAINGKRILVLTYGDPQDETIRDQFEKAKAQFEFFFDGINVKFEYDYINAFKPVPEDIDIVVLNLIPKKLNSEITSKYLNESHKLKFGVLIFTFEPDYTLEMNREVSNAANNYFTLPFRLMEIAVSQEKFFAHLSRK